MLGFLSVSTPELIANPATTTHCFNPVLGFLSVSTSGDDLSDLVEEFQSRAGFSECLDVSVNPLDNLTVLFQSRAGFSECLDLASPHPYSNVQEFQSRAGFSECLDTWSTAVLWPRGNRFNPVLGFLSVST